MHENNIQPNIHSYASCLLAIGNQNSENAVEVIRILNDISKKVFFFLNNNNNYVEISIKNF